MNFELSLTKLRIKFLKASLQETIFCGLKSKSKVDPLPAMKERRGAEVIRSFLISSLDGGEWSVSRSGCFTSGKESQCPLNSRMSGTQS
jgi:hypothetical protein